MNSILENLNTKISEIGNYLPDVTVSILIVAVAYAFYKVTSLGIKKILYRANFEKAVIRLFVGQVYKYVVFIIGILIALANLGVNVTAAVAGLGIAGIAIGFAAQESLANLISGFIIFWDKPFVVGDWIKTNGLYGKVVSITLRSTRIQTKENAYIVMPNQKIINEVLVNQSKHGAFRINMPIGIAFKESIKDARKALLEAVNNIPDILDDPKPKVVVDEIADSSINLKVMIWIENAKDEQEIFYKAIESCKESLDKAGIEIPFPHRQLFIEKMEDIVLKDQRDK
jgi:small conductance mechanosensitive channel